jgi:haloalkane dehalogenase
MAAPSSVFRTPDERFAALPGFSHEPRYVDVDGLRIAWVEAGPADGPPVVLFHGEPTWSFLWRAVIPPLAAAGLRCLAADMAGFGRSDKPEDLAWYSYDRHTAVLLAWLDALDVRDATAVVHDWGGPIGMRCFVERPERFARIVITDTGFFDGDQPMTDAWRRFRDFVERTEDLPVGFLVDGGTQRELDPEEVAAYEAPFPTAASKAGARAFPLMLPTAPDMPGAAEGRRVREAMRADPRPKLLIWADGDPIIPAAVGERMAELLGADAPTLIPDASHFLQEDGGEELGRRIAGWIRSSP